MPVKTLISSRLIPLLAATALAGCGAPQNDAADTADQTACGGEGIVVNDAWARAARQDQPATAAYLSLCSADGNDALVSASFAGANATELHVTVTSEDGTAAMSQTQSIDLPAGETVALKPGGAHIMMIGVTEAIAPGDSPVLTLEFEKADPVEIELEVRDGMSGHHH